MIIYTVKYKRLSFLKRWKKIKKVKSDGLMENGMSRFFILEDETRIEIPIVNVIFKFSIERFYLIKKTIEEKMQREKEQKIQEKKISLKKVVNGRN